MRLLALLSALIISLPLLRADDAKEPPAALKSLVETLINAANAGDWATLAAHSNTPSIYGDDIYNDFKSIKSAINTYTEGIPHKLLKVETVDAKAVRSEFSKEARQFVGENDQLVRVRFEKNDKGKTTTSSALLIFRKVQDQTLLAGSILDPDKKSK